jgi:hypothetical protein
LHGFDRRPQLLLQRNLWSRCAELQKRLIHLREKLLHRDQYFLDPLLVDLEAADEELQVRGQPGIEGNEIAPGAARSSHLREHLRLVFRGNFPGDNVVEVSG